jgi:hypothetical protein
VTNLVRDVQSGNYYAQIRARGKLIWKRRQSLEALQLWSTDRIIASPTACGPVQIRNCALLLVAGFFFLELAFRRKKMEPRVRIELTTVRLQIGCSTAELSRLNCLWQHIVVSS